MNLRSQESLPQSFWQIPKPARILVRQLTHKKTSPAAVFEQRAGEVSVMKRAFTFRI